MIEYFLQKKINVISKVKKKELEEIMRITGIRKTVKKFWMIEKYKSRNILGICDRIYFKEYRRGQSLMFLLKDVGIRSILLKDSDT